MYRLIIALYISGPIYLLAMGYAKTEPTVSGWIGSFILSCVVLYYHDLYKKNLSHVERRM